MKKTSLPVTHPLSDQSSADNILTLIHPRLIQVSITFRSLVCDQCSWSIPTFYRKMKSVGLSNAEREMILKLYLIALKSLKGDYNEEEQLLISNLPKPLMLELQRQRVKTKVNH